MDDLVPTALILLFLATFVFSYADWALRRRKLGGSVTASWDCPHCGLTNEGERSVCWSCDAAISGRNPFDTAPMADTWRCGRCGAWNGTNRRNCWSCSNAPMRQPKRNM